MKVYIDDERPIPEGWTGVRNFYDALKLFNNNAANITHISFDWLLDTRYSMPTGEDLLQELVFTHYNDESIFEHPRENYTVHSSDESAKQRMNVTLDLVCDSTKTWKDFCDFKAQKQKAERVSKTSVKKKRMFRV